MIRNLRLRPLRVTLLRNTHARRVAWMLSVILLASVGAKGGSSIFDEDWNPPKSVKPADPVPDLPKSDTPAQSPPKPPKPGKAGPTPPGQADTPATPASPDMPGRRAVPASVDQAKSRKLFKEVFAKELADHSPPARRALAGKLLDEAATVTDTSADQFVLLVGATEAAKEASDLSICSRAADALADVYDVDALRVKCDAAMKMTLRADSPAVAAENCIAGLMLVDQLATVGDLPTATRLLQVLRAAAPDTELTSQIQKRSKEIDGMRSSAARIKPALEKLKDAPDDAEANLAVGQYLCFVRADWQRGLAYLVKGNKPALTHAATLDLAAPTDSAGQAAVGNLWWDLSEKETGANQHAIRQRATSWYSAALDSADLTGLSRVMLEKRVADAAAQDDSSLAMSRSVLWFADGGEERAALQAISRGRLKQVPRADVARVFADPHSYTGVQIVVWGRNMWRETPREQFTAGGLQAMQQFVRKGGDLVMFEQFATDNMGIFDPVFDIKTSGAAGGAQIISPALKSRCAAAGLTDDALKSINFYNSYLNLPKGSAVLVKNSEAKDVIVTIPYGKGRLIMMGTVTDGGSKDEKLVEEVLDLIYHWKASKAAQAELDRQKTQAHGRSPH